MKRDAPTIAKWVAGALALAFSLAVASFALRPSAPEPEDDSAPVPADGRDAETDGATRFQVPSGLTVVLQEVRSDAEGLRFRFVAPALSEQPFAEIEADMVSLCRSVVIPALAQTGREAELVILSLASAPVQFGETAPDIAQYFEAFRVNDSDCIWEAF